MPFKMKFLMGPEGGDAGAGGGAGGGGAAQAGGGGGDPGAGGGGGATAATETVQVTTKGGKVIPMAATTIDRLKRQHQDKGRKAAQAELDQKAKALGFDSADEMIKAAERARKQQNGGVQRQRANGGNQQRQQQNNGKRPNEQQGQRQQQNANGNRGQRRDDKREREMGERLERERRERIRAQRKADEKEREAWAAEAHGTLKIMALQAGIKDPDYAVTLWTRECEQQRARLPEPEYNKWLDAADESKYFTELKTSRPHLFQEVVIPANTGTTTSGDAPPPPGAGKVTTAQANAARTNAGKMSRDEYNAELRRRGLTPPTM